MSNFGISSDKPQAVYMRKWIVKNHDRHHANRRLWYQRNREKICNQAKEWRKANPERIYLKDRNNQLKKMYGITLVEYDRMYQIQCGCCALCGIHQSQMKKILQVDHCHKTGRVRKLLCNGCNSWIGRYENGFKEKAETYLG